MSPIWLLFSTQAECRSKYSVNFQVRSTLEKHDFLFLYLHHHEKSVAVNEDRLRNGVLEVVDDDDV